MTNFKHILLIAFSLALFSCGKSYDYNAIEGYDFIKNAEKAVQQNEIALAEAYLEKASNSNYGSCGNSWIEAKVGIDLVKAQILNKKTQILNKKGNYDETLQLLESINRCYLGADCNKRDSLKIETLFLKHGKDKVVKAFKSLTDVDKHDDNGFESYSVYIKELEYTLAFGEYLPRITHNENGELTLHEPVDNSFVSVAKACGLYTLIEN